MPLESDTSPRRRQIVLWLPPVLLASCLCIYLVRIYQGRSSTATPTRRAAKAVVESIDSSNRVAASDVWETEEFADAASSQLTLLGEVITNQDEMSTVSISKLISPKFSCSVLRPPSLEPVYETESIRVVRRNAATISEEFTEGADAFVGLLQALTAPFATASDRHVKFKIYGVEVNENYIATNVVYQASGKLEHGSIQQNAEWLCHWRAGASGASPALEKIRLEAFEEVTAKAPTGVLFADCTQAVFQNEPSFTKQILPGIDYWRRGIQSQHGVYAYGHHGIAIGDVNGDGLDDVYACQPAGLPNRLYLQNADGTVKDVSQESGTDWLDRSRGVLLIDIDNDDDQDLAMVVNNMIVFMANDGSGHFTEQAIARATGDAGALVAADYDLDGDLDLFVVSYGQRFLSDGESDGPVPYHDANNGGPNMLLRNEGNWTFTDVTLESGLDTNNRRWSFAASWEDYDSDGDFDLYVSNDFGRNNLYRNDSGTFVDVAATASVEDIAAGMSASWGDYDQDGRMDLYVGNMFSSAGLRISNQARFHAKATDQMRAEFRRHARGNSLFRNEGDGTFRDVSEEAGVTLGRWAWGSNFVDINNDGLEDLVVANGFVTGSDTKDL